MTGINKFDQKDRRRQRRAYQINHIKADLRTPKYRERTIKRKRIEDEEDFQSERLSEIYRV